MKEIIIYCDHWQNGGVEAYIMNQLRYWDLSELRCTILSAEKTTDIYDNELLRLNIKQIVLLGGENDSAISRILKTFKRYEEYISNNPCDIIYLNLTNAVTMRYAKIAERVGVKRRIVHSHGSGIQPGKSHILKIFAHNVAKRLFTKCATDWWACSEEAAHFEYDFRFVNKIVYIPNAIAVNKFRFNKISRNRIRVQLKITDKQIKVIGTVGRCTAEKNQFFLLKVFANIQRKTPNIRLLIVGDGPSRNALELYAKNLKIYEFCCFYGFTDDVAPLYSAMDLFCLPSVVEGFGIVALEAQAAGCSCLLSNAVSKQAKATEDSDIIFLPLQEDVWETEILDQLEKTERNRENISIYPQYNIEMAARMTQGRILKG